MIKKRLVIPQLNKEIDKCCLSSFRILKKKIKWTKNSLLSGLNTIEQSRIEVSLAKKAFARDLIIETAQQINISHININTSDHISIYSLEAAGIRNIADLMCYPKRYNTIYGIGDITGGRITRNLSIIKKQICDSIKLIITPDKYCSSAAELLKAVVNNVCLETFSDSFKNAANDIYGFQSQLSIVKKRHTSLRTLFSKKYKQSVCDEYNSIVKELSTYLNNLNNQLISRYNEVELVSVQNVWKSMKENIDDYVAILNPYSIQIAYSEEISKIDIAKNIFITNDQIDEVLKIIEQNNLGENERNKFLTFVKNQCKVVADERLSNYQAPEHLAKYIDFNPNYYFLVWFEFKSYRCDLINYLFQVFEHVGRPVKRQDKYYYSTIDTRSIEWAYIDWLRRKEGVLMSKMWVEGRTYIHPSIYVNRISPLAPKQFQPGHGYSDYLKAIRNYYNRWPVDEKVMNEIFSFHSAITTELYLTGKKKFRHKNEAMLFKLVKKRYPDALFQFRITWLKTQSLDIYIPSLKVGIEYQGTQHFRPYSKDDAATKNFVRQQERDKRKSGLCAENGIRLLYWYYDKDVTTEEFEKFVEEIENSNN